MKEVVAKIKLQIKEINEQEREKHSPPKILTLESLLLGKEDRVSDGNKNHDSMAFNALLYRAQQMTYRKKRIVNPVALERRARAFHGVEPEDGRLVDQDLETLKARSKASNYYQITDSENYLNDLTLDTFQKPWGKLEATIKINRAIKYAESLQIKYSLSAQEFKNLRILLIGLINRKQITRKADVNYDETAGELVEIPSLIWDSEKRSFDHIPAPSYGSTRVRTNKKNNPSPTPTMGNNIRKGINGVPSDQGGGPGPAGPTGPVGPTVTDKTCEKGSDSSDEKKKIPVIVQRKVELTGITELTEDQKKMLATKFQTFSIPSS